MWHIVLRRLQNKLDYIHAKNLHASPALKMSPSVYSAGLLCSLVAVAAYINTLDCGLCFDDNPGIVKNQDLRPNVSWANLLWDDFWGTPMGDDLSHRSYRPLCVATFRLNYLLHELQPMGYHLVNVLLHSAVCYLYVQLCGVIFSTVWPALIAGLLFAVHPIHTEAVAGVVGRADVLGGLFFIGSILSYRKASHSSGLGLRWLILTMLLCLCSVLSKETGITVLAVCLMYECFILNTVDVRSVVSLLTRQPFSKYPKWLKYFLVRAVILVTFATVFMAVRLKLNQGMPKFTRHDNPTVHFSSPYRQLQWLHLCFVNSWLMLSPFHLSCDWRMGGVPMVTSLISPWNIATLATLTAIATLGMYGIRGKELYQKHTLFALVLIIFPYLPASNLLFPVGFVVAERILYIPSMGICVLTASGIWHVVQHAERKLAKWAVLVGLGYLLVAFSVKTVQRNRDWYSDRRLYESAVHIFPENALMMNNLAIQYNETGNMTAEMEVLLTTACRLAPNVTLLHVSLGRLLRDQERFSEAEKIFRRAAMLSHADSKADVTAGIYYELGKLLLKNETISRTKAALKAYSAAVKIKPNFSEYLHSQGYVLLKLNMFDEAVYAFEAALRDNPDHIGANYKLGKILVDLGDLGRAEQYFRRVLSINESALMTKFQLGALLLKSTEPEKLQEAEQLLSDVLAVEPDNENAIFGLGIIRYNFGNFQEAIKLFNRTLQLNASHPGALYNLGYICLQLQKYSEALPVLVRLVNLDPLHVTALTHLGTCYVHLKEYSRAVEFYEAALRVDPDNALTLFNLGVVKTQLKEVEEAIQLLTHALQLEPTSKQVRTQLSKTQQLAAKLLNNSQPL